MQIELVNQDEGVYRFRLSGEVTQRKLRKFVDPLEQIGDPVYQGIVAFDMSQTEFIDSSGVNWILSCHKKCRHSGGRLVLHSIPNMVHNVLMVLRMNDVMQLAADESAALDLARQPLPAGDPPPPQVDLRDSQEEDDSRDDEPEDNESEQA